MMQWDDVRYFLGLARAGNLSAAARLLEVEHTTVARRVTQLEASLGVKLFDRLARGWTLTHSGSLLLEHAQVLEAEIFSFQRIASGIDALTGTVRISAPPLLCYFLASKLQLLNHAYPNITLELAGERQKINLIKGEASIAIRLRRPEEEGLVARSLGILGYGLYATESVLELPKDAQSYLVFDSSIKELSIKKWLDDYVGNRPIRLRSNDIMALFNAAITGSGITLLPHFLGRSHPSLRHIASDSPPIAPIFLVMHPDIRRAQHVRVIANNIVALFEAEKAFFN